MPTSYKQNMQFEAEVRWVAEAVWSMTPGTCQPSHYIDTPGINELDGIARLRDVTHLIMATTSTRLAKIKDDVKKLNAAERHERKRTNAVSKWLITRAQLDAQHIDYASNHHVTILTLEQFKQRFFDGRKYIARREVSSFGSARNPRDNSVTFPDNAYVVLPMAKAETVRITDKGVRRTEERHTPIELEDIKHSLTQGIIVVLIAPFGAGKSVTTREIFRRLAKDYKGESSTPVPICINLREHWGQEHADEILERHARSIAFTPLEDLVIAWRAGLSTLLLDGFDEVASQTIVREDDINFMKGARRIALSGVRDFLTKLPSGTGVFLCGRDHYFDNEQEMEHALGLSGKKHIVVRLDEFTDDTAAEFLKRNGVETCLPDWLPKKPLILSYLIQNNLLDSILSIDASQGYGFAWDSFIQNICEREAELERAVMDAHTLRRVMERLAFSVRSFSSGTGPITGTDLANTYTAETGQSAGEGVLAQLQRLPGLTQRDTDAGSRSFVDQDMLWALQGGALARIISGEFGNVGSAPLQALAKQAVVVAAYILKRDGATSATPMAIVKRLTKETMTPTIKQVVADAFSVAVLMAKDDDETLDGHGLEVDGATLDSIDFEESDLRNISFQDCVFSEVVIAPRAVQSGVMFHRCIINRLGGVGDKSGMPVEIFGTTCEIDNFDNMATNNAVLQLDMAPQMKALLTVLRKLYRQSGAGRKKAALSRGITQPDVLNCIPQVIATLERFGFARVFNNVVHPVRKNANRVDAILSAPSLSDDELVVAVKEL